MARPQAAEGAAPRWVPVPWRPAILVASRTIVLSLIALECVVLVLWATEQGSNAGADGALRSGLAVWLAAHRTGFEIHGGHFGATPYTLTLLPAVLLWRAGGRLVRMHAVFGQEQIVRAAGAVAAGYATVNVLLCFVASQPGARPIPSQALLGSAALAFATTAGGALRADGWSPALPGRLSAVLRATGTAVLALVSVSCLVLAITAVVRHHAIYSTGHAVAPSASGTVGIVLLDLLAVPLAVVWAASLLLGPGFGLGAHTGVSLASANYGPVPGLPLLAAVPAPGPFSWAALLLLSIPVGAGVAAGLRLARGTQRANEIAIRALQTGVFAGLFFALLAWLSDGPIGPGRLSVAGPSPWQTGLAAFVEIGGGALLVAGAQAIRRRR